MQRADEASASERMLNEATFRERRRRVLRAEGLVAGVFLMGLAAVALAKETAPDAFEAATAAMVLGTAAALLWVRRTAARHWRCPVCETRWETRDSLASLHWNHCADCGAPLRAYPRQRDRERLASTAFALEGLSPDQLLERFEHRRRRVMLAGGLLAVAGVAALLGATAWGVSELGQQGVVAGFAAGVAGLLLWGNRCPRCQTGLIGRDRHCQRCGMVLKSELSAELDRRPGA